MSMAASELLKDINSAAGKHAGTVVIAISN
jgi:hypothetical protein